jgi:hypothetical protein
MQGLLIRVLLYMKGKKKMMMMEEDEGKNGI